MILRILIGLLLAPAERRMLNAFASMDAHSQRDLLSIGSRFARQFPQRHAKLGSPDSVVST